MGTTPNLRTTPTQAFVAAANQAANANMRSQAYGDIGQLGLAMLGIGAAARGATGLAGLLRKNLASKAGPQVVTLPYPVADEDDDRQKKRASAFVRVPLAGAAVGAGLGGLHSLTTGDRLDQSLGRGAIAGGVGGLSAIGGGVVGTVGTGLGLAALAGLSRGRLRQTLMRMSPTQIRNTLLTGSAAGAGSGAAFGYVGAHRYMNDKPAARPAAPATPADRAYKKAFDVTSKTAIPWYRPAMLLAGMGGLYGGWKGVDAALDAQRRSARDKEVEEAKREFHDALMAQYDKPLKTSLGKAGAAPADLLAGLGRVFGQLEKVAQHVKRGGRLNDLGGEAAGIYGSYALLSGLATGALVYEQARKRQRREILNKALQRRDRHRYYTAPPEIVAVPEPVKAIKKPAPQLAAEPPAEMVETQF